MSNNNAVNNIFKNQPVTQTAISYTALATDVIIEVTNTSAARTITLPTAIAGNKGKFYVIKDTSGGAATNNITVTPTTGTLDGAASAIINTNYGFLQVYSDGSAWYTQANTATGEITQYGSTVATANVTPANSSPPTSALTFMYVTVPSAGVWRINYVVRGNVSAQEISSALFTGGNTTIGGATGGTLVPNSEILTAVNGGGQQGTGTGSIIVTTGAATTYVCGVYSGTGVNAGVAIAGDEGGRSSMNYVQIGGFANLAPSVPVRTYLGSVFSSTTHGSYVDLGLSTTVPAGTYALRYNLSGSVDNNGNGSLTVSAKFVNVTAGNIDVTNSYRELFSVGESVGISSTCGGTGVFDLQVTNAVPTTYKIQVQKFTSSGGPNPTQSYRIYAESFIEYRPDIY